MKIKLFFWLMAENKVLTWQILQQKGWQGLGRCYLCKEENKDTNHLFIHCDFTKSVWHRIIARRKYKHSWHGTDFEDCITNWCKNKLVPVSLVALTC
jgi:hypothetical protein